MLFGFFGGACSMVVASYRDFRGFATVHQGLVTLTGTIGFSESVEVLKASECPGWYY